ncbi:MAG: hypothetical protein K8953_04460, partial [Proteobacteria bacterium]|nr:hypothetical protein [Pseudomonadota bacterium]
GLNTGGIRPRVFTRRPEFEERVYNLNFDTGTFKGQYLNGDAEDGVAFFSGYNKSIAYAGILSGTDLGAPVNQTGTAIWNGTISNTISGSKPVDFSLNINFGGPGQGGRIDGFYRVYVSGYRNFSDVDLSGEFDAKGVISGTVQQRYIERNTTIDSRVGDYQRSGPLTGLIGEEGAVGAFLFKTNDSTLTSFNRFTSAGGFVVRPSATFATPEPLVNNAQVTTADWLTSVKQDESSYFRRYRLLEASKTGLSTANNTGIDYHVLTLADSTFDGRDLGGDRADGVAFSSPHLPRVGVLSGSDLGAPLTQQQGTVYWEGKMIAVGITEVFKDFKLQINFGEGDQVGTISAFVDARYPDLGYHYRLDGSFDTNGVIKGTTESGMFMPQNAKIPQYWRNSGTLTGLIGEEGAVGVFFSRRIGRTGYVGGFVAKPNITPATIPTPVAVTPVERVTKDIWLSTLDKEDRPSNTYVSARLNFSSGLYIDGEANNGFFLRSIAPSSFAEILPSTDLGAPLTQTTGSVRWNGLFVSDGFGWGPNLFHSDFVLEVSFGGPDGYAGRIDAVFAGQTASLAVYLRGVFDDNGVISGRVFYGNFLSTRRPTTDYGAFQTLTGLIGQKGAVGVIDSSPGHPGAGFIASPKAINVVHYADWKVPHVKNAPEWANYNQFIASRQGGLNVGNLKNADGTVAVVNTLNFNSADN